MRRIILPIIILFFISITPAYAQLDDILDKVGDQIEKEIEKEKREKKKQEEKKKKEEERRKREEAERIANENDTTFESEFHRNHVGEIAFCKDRNPDLKSDILFEELFSNDDNITACVYLKTPVKAYPVFDATTAGKEVKPHHEREYFIKIYIDGSDAGKPHYIYSDYKDNKNNSFFLEFKDKFNFYDLPDGKHSIKAELWGGKPGLYSTSEAIAKGEFTFNKIDKEEITGRFSNIQAGMKNSNLEKQALDVINSIAVYENWKERYTKAKITSTDWTIVRNEWTGIITHRKIYMVLYGVWPNGKCRYTEFSFFQDYDGRNYQNTLQYNAIGSMYRVECE